MASPNSISDWIAWLGLVVTLLGFAASVGALAWAALRHVNNEAERRRRDDNERIEHLERVIYNRSSEHGLGAQVLAIDELGQFPKRREAILRLARVMEAEYKQKNVPAQLDAVQALIKKLDR